MTIPLHIDQLKKQCVEIGNIKDRYRRWSYYDEKSGKVKNWFFFKIICTFMHVKDDVKARLLRIGSAHNNLTWKFKHCLNLYLEFFWIGTLATIQGVCS